MSKGMLGLLTLSDVQGPMSHLEQQLAGENGPVVLGELKKFLRKETCWGVKNTSATGENPFTPEGWTVEEHRHSEFDPTKVKLHLSPAQAAGKSVQGHKLRKELIKLSVANANALDFYLANPHLIDEKWKGKLVFFWGTIYRDRGGNLCVRCLCWRGGRWRWLYHWLDSDFDDGCPALLLES